MGKRKLVALLLVVIVLCATTNVAALELVDFNSPVIRGEIAKLKVKGIAGKTYSIVVKYKSGPSTAEGLESKPADNKGFVYWEWKVGPRTTPGEWEVTISNAGKPGLTLKLVVTK